MNTRKSVVFLVISAVNYNLPLSIAVIQSKTEIKVFLSDFLLGHFITYYFIMLLLATKPHNMPH